MSKCFIEATKENTEMLTRFSEIIIMSVFSKERNPQTDGCRLLALTERFLVYYKVSTNTHSG
jgi:hypothetical protein